MISTRKKIVVIADQLIRSKGYNAFSYADIASTLNIKNAAIHYYFPSKGALGQAVIEESREKFKKNIALWAQENAYERIRLFIEMYSKNSKNNCICFMGALGSSFNTLPKTMSHELTEAHNEIVQWLISTLSEGKDTGEFEFDETTEEMTDLITSGLLASLILQRVSHTPVLDNVSHTLLKRLEKKPIH